MSKIFDAIKRAQLIRSGQSEANPPPAKPGEVPDRRRSRRWMLDEAVYVYGYDPQKEPFHEEAHTLRVNANGGLLLLSVPVREGQQLLLTNVFTQQEQPCRVVFLGKRRTRTIETGVEFPASNAAFWRLPKEPGSDKTE